MADLSVSDLGAPGLAQPRRMVRLDTILRLRWLAILGQLAAILTVSEGLGFDVAIMPCLAVLGFAGAVNIALQVAFPAQMHQLPPLQAAGLLALHAAELAALLFLTGGLQNPFSFMLMVPVLIAATTLPPKLTLAVGIFATACASALGFIHMPLPWSDDDPLILPRVYMIGVWLSIVLAIGVTSLYAFQVTEQARKLSDALAATELVLAREQHLTQLDGLAAAAAHELGTPLGTIAVVARELERRIEASNPMADDVRVLREQAQRCRDILAKLTQLSAAGAPFDRMPLSALLEEVVAPHREFGISIKIRISRGDSEEPVVMRNPAILYGLGNILENAVDFARNTVEVNAWWDTETVEIVIADDGPGIAPDVLNRIGEPYLSRRRDEGSGGLGLGIFIARTLLERSGGATTFRNRVFPEHGAIVQITWPRTSFEAGKALIISG